MMCRVIPSEGALRESGREVPVPGGCRPPATPHPQSPGQDQSAASPGGDWSCTMRVASRAVLLPTWRRRIRIARHRTVRWFRPPVRALGANAHH